MTQTTTRRAPLAHLRTTDPRLWQLLMTYSDTSTRNGATLAQALAAALTGAHATAREILTYGFDPSREWPQPDAAGHDQDQVTTSECTVAVFTSTRDGIRVVQIDPDTPAIGEPWPVIRVAVNDAELATIRRGGDEIVLPAHAHEFTTTVPEDPDRPDLQAIADRLTEADVQRLHTLLEARTAGSPSPDHRPPAAPGPANLFCIECATVTAHAVQALSDGRCVRECRTCRSLKNSDA